MGTVEDVARLKLETIGAEGLQELRDKLKALPQALGEVTAAFGRGDITLEEYEADAKRITSAYKQMSSELDKLDAVSKKAKGGMAGLGQAGLQTGRVIQDFAQGGIGGILNNIEGLSMALGGGPGLAGTLTGLGIAFFLLKKPIEEFLTSLVSGDVVKFGDSILDLKDKIKDLTDKPIKLLVDVIQLEDAKRRLKELEEGERALQAAREGKSLEEKEAGDAVKKALEDQGDVLGRALPKMVEAVFNEKFGVARDRGQKQIAAQQAQIDRLDQRIAATFDPEQRAALEQQKTIAERGKQVAEGKMAADAGAARQAAETEIGKALAGAKAGNAPGEKSLLEGRLRQVGEGDLAKKIEAITPQSVAAGKQLDADLKALVKDAEDQSERAKKAAAAAKAAAKAENDMLNAQGAQNAPAALKEAAALKRERDAAAREVQRRAGVIGKDQAEQAKGFTLAQDQAEALIAQGVAKGTMQLGPNGQLTQASFDRLVNELAVAMHQANRGGNAIMQADVASRIIQNAERSLGLAGDQAQNMMIVANKIAQINARLNNIDRGVRDGRRQLQAPGPANLPAGFQ